MTDYGSTSLLKWQAIIEKNTVITLNRRKLIAKEDIVLGFGYQGIDMVLTALTTRINYIVRCWKRK